jgi:hypothetical protein
MMLQSCTCMVLTPPTPCSGCTIRCAQQMQVHVITRLCMLLCTSCDVRCLAQWPNQWLEPSSQRMTPSACAQASKLFVKGHMGSLDTLRQYRVALAPLRFGAGLKGKVVDSWAHGLPVCILHSNTAQHDDRAPTWHRLYHHNNP